MTKCQTSQEIRHTLLWTVQFTTMVVLVYNSHTIYIYISCKSGILIDFGLDSGFLPAEVRTKTKVYSISW